MVKIALGTVGMAAFALPTASPAKPAKPPKSSNKISIAATPPRIRYGRSTTIAGQLTGPDSASKTVTLQDDDYPYGSFRNVGTMTTSATGDYSFTSSPGLNTSYRVVAKTSPDTTSDAVLVTVAQRISLGRSDSTPKKGQRVTFYGHVAPAHDGRTVLIQRRTSSGSWVTIKTTTLLDDGASRSRYSKRIRIFSTATFRAVVKADADHGKGKSKPRTVTVS